MKTRILVKKTPVIVLLLFISLITFISCKKLLEVNLDGYVLTTENYYKTPIQLETALRGIYSTLGESFMYGNTMLGRMGLEADEGFPNSPSENGTVTYYAASSTDDKLLNHWRALYKGINRANLLLSNVENKEINIDQTERDHIHGQALFLRGYYYFMLVSRFGGVPLVLKPSMSGKAEEVQIPKATTKEVYEQVLSDMEKAADLVNDVTKVESAGRISKSAVWGILARVCLYMAGYPLNETARYADAEKWAGKVILSGQHALNDSYQQIFINYARDKYDIRESILEVEFWGNGTGLYSKTGGYVGIHNGIQYSANGIGGFGYSTGLIHPSKWLYDLYEVGDLRRDWSIAPYRYLADKVSAWPNTTDIINRFSGKFRREYEILTPKSTTSTPQNFPLLRYSDVLLMYAEAINEANKMPDNRAYDAMNQVRRRAVGTAADKRNPQVDIVASNYEDFKAELKNERARELCFEALRKNDVVRWGDFYKNMRSILKEIPTAGTATVYVSARSYYGNVAERDVVWPLPSNDLGLNSSLIQNEGW